MSEIEWVYGYGRTKHIKHEHLVDRYGTAPGLCGAWGGRSSPSPSLPVCKHCQRIADRTEGDQA